MDELNSAEAMEKRLAAAEKALRELVATHLKKAVLGAAELQHTAITDLVQATIAAPCVIELPLGTYTAAVQSAARAADEMARESGHTVRLKPSTVTKLAWALHVVAAKPST